MLEYQARIPLDYNIKIIMNSCLDDLRMIDRSSFTLSARLPSQHDEQVHDPFIRTQSLFKKNTSRQLLYNRDSKPPFLFEQSSQAQLEQQTILVDKAMTRQAAVYEKLLDQRQHTIYGDAKKKAEAIAIGQVSFFDSFGKAMDDRTKRIQTQPNQPVSYSRKTDQQAKSIFVMGQDERQRLPTKPVTQFFLNLNIQPEKQESFPSRTQNTRKFSGNKFAQSLDFYQVIQRLSKAMQNSSSKVIQEVSRRFPQQITVELNRIAQQIQSTHKINQNKLPLSPLINNKIVKQRDCYDNNKKVHIEMVKVQHKSPQQRDTYRKPKERKSTGKGFYALKSKYKLK